MTKCAWIKATNNLKLHRESCSEVYGSSAEIGQRSHEHKHNTNDDKNKATRFSSLFASFWDLRCMLLGCCDTLSICRPDGELITKDFLYRQGAGKYNLQNPRSRRCHTATGNVDSVINL